MLGLVYSQKTWPGIGAGPLDDCWVLASLKAVHAVAPWLVLPGVKRFREAAGKPDSNAVTNGGDEHAMAKGITTLFPKLTITVADGLLWAQFTDLVKSGHPAALIVDSDKLPPAHQFGYSGPGAIHAITVAFEGGVWLDANPLARPHSRPLPIEQPQLRAAVEGYKANVHAVLMPTEAEAFKTHPLYAATVAAANVAGAASVDCSAAVKVATAPLELELSKAHARISAATAALTQ